MKNRLLFFYFLAVIALHSCKKDKQTDANPAIGFSPSIELISISPTTIHQFSDSIKFEIKYTDGDGNVGDYNADSTSLIIADNRNSSLLNKFHIPPVSPQGSNLVVQGNFLSILKSIILLNSASSSETTTFSIKLKDRAGNWSNSITTPIVTILP